jgi:hypothetical protein
MTFALRSLVVTLRVTTVLTREREDYTPATATTAVAHRPYLTHR